MGCSVQKPKENQRNHLDQIEKLIQSDCLSNESRFMINNNPIIKRRNCSREKKNLQGSLQI
ncbi:unnamed protein product [Paramecium octaurelia]|uniref:Uncharacterized protein n=1 Tax=Paramecium octaurelia TaxID=43137 RepID=A0A8S1T7H0_PAROT|nr:unnamed protein product [Paramecium octaurelia]